MRALYPNFIIILNNGENYTVHISEKKNGKGSRKRTRKKDA